MPALRARNASSLSPASSARTTRSSCRLLIAMSLRAPASDNQQDGAADDGRVGDVEDGPEPKVDEVDDLAAQEPRLAGKTVDEVAVRAAEHETKGERMEPVGNLP